MTDNDEPCPPSAEWIADRLRGAGLHRSAASVTSWRNDAARLIEQVRRLNDELRQALERYYALRGAPREFNAEGKPPAESSD